MNLYDHGLPERSVSTDALICSRCVVKLVVVFSDLWAGTFEAEEDITEFVKCKIESLVAAIETADEGPKEGEDLSPHEPTIGLDIPIWSKSEECTIELTAE